MKYFIMNMRNGPEWITLEAVRLKIIWRPNNPMPTWVDTYGTLIIKYLTNPSRVICWASTWNSFPGASSFIVFLFRSHISIVFCSPCVVLMIFTLSPGPGFVSMYTPFTYWREQVPIIHSWCARVDIMKWTNKIKVNINRNKSILLDIICRLFSGIGTVLTYENAISDRRYPRLRKAGNTLAHGKAYTGWKRKQRCIIVMIQKGRKKKEQLHALFFAWLHDGDRSGL